MFGLGSKKKKLEKKYQKKLVEALEAQRNGNIALYSELSSEADKILKEIEELERQGK
ncbi:DUF6435 family protein [Halobacteriovorax sp. DPLXC-1]|uniref:DUF6435 family protein n=1 Tax=unclassified Halobacteriovorax TaxID=2639665 RepID=UPI002FEEC32C